MQFTRLMLIYTSPLAWKNDPLGYSAEIRDFLLDLLDPAKPGFAALGATISDSNETRWLEGEEGSRLIHELFSKIWEPQARRQILARDAVGEQGFIFDELIKYKAQLFLNLKRLNACFEAKAIERVKSEVRLDEDTFISFFIDWSHASGNVLFTPQLCIGNFWPANPHLAPPQKLGITPPAPMNPERAAEILEYHYWLKLGTEFHRLRYAFLGVYGLDIGGFDPPVFYFAAPSERSDTHEQLLAPPHLTALETLARTTIATPDLHSANTAGAFLEGNLLTFSRELITSGANRSYYLVIPWLSSEEQWAEVEWELSFIADKLSFIDCSFAYNLWYAATALEPCETQSTLMTRTLDDAGELVQHLQQRVAFGRPPDNITREVYELVVLLRSELARLEARSLKLTDDLLAIARNWPSQVAGNVHFAFRTLTASPLPEIAFLLEQLDKREAFRIGRTQIETALPRAQQVRDYFNDLSTSLSYLLEQERHERQEREEQNQRTLSYSLAALAAVTAFPIVIGQMSWSDLQKEMEKWPFPLDNWLRTALENIHPHLVLLSMIGAGLIIVLLTWFLIRTRLRLPLRKSGGWLNQHGKALRELWASAKQAEFIMRTQRLEGETDEVKAQRQDIDQMDRDVCKNLVKVWDALASERSAMATKPDAIEPLRNEVEHFILQTELFANPPGHLWLPRTLCLFRFRSTDFVYRSVIPYFVFQNVMGAFGFKTEELATLERCAGEWRKCSTQQFIDKLNEIGVSAVHNKRIEPS